MEMDFFSGCMGFVFASFLGFAITQMQKARRRVGAHKRKQTVSMQTNDTPQEVTRDHFKAMFEVAGWVIVLTGTLWGFVIIVAF